MKPVIHASRRGFMTALGGAASAAALMGQQSESARTWRVGVIGRTGHGDYGHGLDVVWKKFPNARIVAVADDNPEGLKKAAERLGVRSTYSDYRQMLRQERPDVVSIAPRWADSHHDMVLAAAEAGASIYIEKPLARTPAEADRMIAGCDRAHVKLAVAHQMRISPLLDLARQRLAEGIIGQLLELRGRGKEDARGGGEDPVRPENSNVRPVRCELRATETRDPGGCSGSSSLRRSTRVLTCSLAVYGVFLEPHHYLRTGQALRGGAIVIVQHAA